MYKIFALPLIAFYHFTALAQTQPAWITTSIHPLYSKQNYWTSVGYGKGSEARGVATESAQKEIAAQLNITIQAQMSLVSESVLQGTNENIKEKYSSTIKSEINSISLSGIEVVETFTNDTKETWIFSVLDKKKYLLNVKNELQQKQSQALDLYSKSNDAFLKGELLLSSTYYVETQKALDLLLPRVVYYNSLANDKFDLSSKLINFQSEFTKMLAFIRVELIGAAPKEIELNKPMATPIKAQILYNNATIKGLDCIIRAKEQVVTKVKTDSSGIILLQFIPQFTMITANKLALSIELLPPTIIKDLKQYFKKDVMLPVINIKILPFNYQLEIVGSMDAISKNKIKQTIQKALEENGGTLKKRASISIQATIEMTNSQTLQSFAGENYIEEATCNIVFKDTNGEVITTAVCKGKGMDVVKTKSVQKAISSIMITSQILSEAVTKIIQ